MTDPTDTTRLDSTDHAEPQGLDLDEVRARVLVLARRVTRIVNEDGTTEPLETLAMAIRAVESVGLDQDALLGGVLRAADNRAQSAKGGAW